jgi:hypothetical protein
MPAEIHLWIGWGRVKDLSSYAVELLWSVWLWISGNDQATSLPPLLPVLVDNCAQEARR